MIARYLSKSLQVLKMSLMQHKICSTSYIRIFLFRKNLFDPYEIFPKISFWLIIVVLPGSGWQASNILSMI